ncbi:MAG: class II aldolase/adducin family protein [Acidimicrobiia bacterium]|nr:class II aldolase/adducin family protein [Acidimicrobiia bacterium]
MTDDMDRLRRRVVDVAQGMAAKGLVEGTAGNVSARTPDGHVLLTPSSVPYDDITPDNLAHVDLAGELIDGNNPSSERSMHLACYRAYPEVGGVMHCHPTYASMFAVARQPIPAAIEEVVVYVGGDIPVCDYQTTGTDELGDEVARNVADRSAALMANHGMLTVGPTVDEAFHVAAVVEKTAQIVWGARLLAAGAPLGEVPDDVNANFENVYRYVRSDLWKS